MSSFRFLGVLLLLSATAPFALGETIYISARQARTLSPTMVLGDRLGLQDDSALGSFLVPTVCSEADKADGHSYAEFSVDVHRPATYYVWARLRCLLAADESFALMPQGSDASPIVLGGRGAENRDWHWTGQNNTPDRPLGLSRLKIDLKAGTLIFRITAREAHATVYRPLRWPQAEPAFNPRLNLLCLTSDASYVPSDADAQKVLKLDRAANVPLPRVTNPTLPSLTDAQWRRAGKQPVADWLRCARWYTKDSWREELAYRSPGDIAALVRQIAACEASVFRLSVFWGGETYYQSRVAPHAPGLKDLDYLREAVDEGHRRGMKIVVYINPNALNAGHPLFEQCVIRTADGRRSDRPAYGGSVRGQTAYACINHPRYRQFLRDVLQEIFTRYQPDGLYVDGLSPHVCFCEHCRAKYRRMFAAEMPAAKFARDKADAACWGEMQSDPPLVGRSCDVDTCRLTAMFSRSLAEVTELFTRTVKGCKPDAVAVYHSYPKPDSIAFYDATLTEIYAQKPWVHSTWKFGELANYSNVFPIPVFFNIYPHDRFTAAEARDKAFQGLANGVFPNYWSTMEMKPVFAFLRRNAEFYDFAMTTPVKFLALARDFRPDAAQQAAPLPTGVKCARDRFIAPAVGAYSALLRSALPVVALHRSGFERQLAGFRVLVLPNSALLSNEQVDAVREFVRAGGGLICTHETSLYDEKGVRRSDFALADVLGIHYRGVLPAAVRSLRVTAPSHPVVAALVGLPADQDEPQVVVDPTAAETLAYSRTNRPGEAETIPAVLVHRFGKGRVVYLPGRPDAMQCETLCPWIERLYASAVRWVAQERPPVEIRAGAMVGVTLFDQPQRRVLHLLNYNRDTRYQSDDVGTLHSVAVDLAVPSGRRIQRIQRLWNPAELPFTQTADRVKFSLPDLGSYEAVSLEFVGW